MWQFVYASGVEYVNFFVLAAVIKSVIVLYRLSSFTQRTCGIAVRLTIGVKSSRVKGIFFCVKGLLTKVEMVEAIKVYPSGLLAFA
jgi:hypothetical protein